MDLIFAALADPVRRRMVEIMAEGPVSVSELATAVGLTLPAVLQHLSLLEASGLAVSQKTGRVRLCRIDATALRHAQKWLAQRQIWRERLVRLEAALGNPDERMMRMTDRKATLGTFSLERRYAASPAKVFAAFGNPAIRRKLFGAEEGNGTSYALDFRVGGSESTEGPGPNGASFVYAAEFRDIVPDQRVVYDYEMKMNGERISVSVAAIELSADGEGTRLKLTESGFYLDGLDTAAQREEGTNFLFNMLGELIAAA